MAEPLLQERNFGELRGRLYDGLGFDPLSMVEAPPGGESALAFRQRVGLAFAQIARLAASLPGDIVVVTHGLVIREMLAGLPPRPGSSIPERIGNTSLTSLCSQPPYAIECLNDTSHLQSGSDDDPGSLSGA